MRLGAGATSTQYSDGTTSYSGVSDKFGKIDAIYGGDGKLGFINGMKGHEYASKHNSINEDMFVNRTNVSNDYTGEMTINGEQAFGRYMYDKDNKQGVFSGQIGGDKVDMTLDNVNGFRIDERGEQDSMAHINGDVGQMSVNGTKTFKSGNITEENLNVHTIKGGADVSGYNASNAMLQSGLSNFVSDKGIREAFVNNQAGYLNSFANRKGNDTLSEQQALEAMGRLAVKGSTGWKLVGNGAEVVGEFGASLRANLQHGSDRVNTVDFNRIMTDATLKQLDVDKGSGMFNNPDGTFSASMYDNAAKERFGLLESSLKGEYDKIYGPGNTTEHILNTVQEGGKQVIDYGAQKANKIIDKIK